ncbi:MAG TPA: hypothetical protein VFQ23_11765 [Anaerolineales bacterium]|nr:hypothetical protein [Anaerolineales bacterium]
MFNKAPFHMLVVITVLVITACAPQVPATSSTQPPTEPVTLSLAVADQVDRASDPYVREFIEQTKTLSNGSITIQPIWDAGAYTTPSFEEGIIKALKQGRYDLGLVAARAFDTQGITSFQALQAPFLITDDALAKAVAASDISAGMLDRLSSAGMVGLTLWHQNTAFREDKAVWEAKPWQKIADQ